MAGRAESEGIAMRLKRHREDVKLLQESWGKHGGAPVFADIAKRYLNLILMAEEVLLKLPYSERRHKVIKGAGGKK